MTHATGGAIRAGSGEPTAHPSLHPHEPTTKAVARDFIAGVVVFLVALPLCLGIALASGAPLMAGLTSGIIGGILIGSLSGSHISVSGPAAGLAAIVLAQITALGSFEAFLLAVTLAGVLQFGFGLLRGGALAKFFPSNVIKGLLAAIGLLLILKQVPHLVGYDADWEGDSSFQEAGGGNTFSTLLHASRAVLPGAALVGLASLAVLVAWNQSPLKKTIVPGPLVAVVFGTGLSELLRWTGSGLAISASHLVSMPVVGQAGVTYADLIRFPDFSQLGNPQVYVAALTIAIVASLETLLNLEATDKLDPYKRDSPPDRELLAQGVGNTLAGLVGGLPMTSVIVRSSVNANAGSRTRRSAIVHGVLLLVALLLLPQVMNTIPLASLAAVLIVTGYKLASPQLFKDMWAQSKSQFLPFIATVAAIVFTDLLKGVIIGMLVSASSILLAHRKHGVRVIREEHVTGPVTRIEFVGQATFLNRVALVTALDACREGDHVLIDARIADYVDADIIALVAEYVNEIGPARGVAISLVGFKDRYPLEDQVLYVNHTTRELQASLTPERVLQLLQEGNERFVTGQRLHRDLALQVDATAEGQHAMAAVVSCIDSRVPAELLFDLGIGDIFSVRLAGNVASRKAVGSLEFACKIGGAKLILVLGHTRCGAVKAACDFAAARSDAQAQTGLTHLGTITDEIAEAVQAETHTHAHRDGSNDDFVDRVARINVRNTMVWIEQNSPTLAEMLRTGEIALVGAMYDVTTGRVEVLDGLRAPAPTVGAAAA